MRTSFAKLSEPPSPVQATVSTRGSNFRVCVRWLSLNELSFTFCLKSSLAVFFPFVIVMSVQDCSPAFSQCRPSLLDSVLQPHHLSPSPPALLSFLMWLGKKKKKHYSDTQIVSIYRQVGFSFSISVVVYYTHCWILSTYDKCSRNSIKHAFATGERK